MQDVTNRELRQIVESPELLAELRDKLNLGTAGRISRADGTIYVQEAGPGWSPPAGGSIQFSLEGRLRRIHVQRL